jgi:hypothetical protein
LVSLGSCASSMMLMNMWLVSDIQRLMLICSKQLLRNESPHQTYDHSNCNILPPFLYISHIVFLYHSMYLFVDDLWTF